MLKLFWYTDNLPIGTATRKITHLSYFSISWISCEIFKSIPIYAYELNKKLTFTTRDKSVADLPGRDHHELKEEGIGSPAPAILIQWLKNSTDLPRLKFWSLFFPSPEKAVHIQNPVTCYLTLEKIIQQVDIGGTCLHVRDWVFFVWFIFYVTNSTEYLVWKN